MCGSASRAPVKPKFSLPAYDRQVMFSACPCISTLTGYIASSFAPPRYSVWSGPGTLEIARLNIGLMRPAAPVRMPMMYGAMNSVV